MHACAAKLNNLISLWLEYGEVKFLRGIITQILGRAGTCLQAIGSNNLLGAQMLYNQMVTDRIKWVGIKAGRVGLRQPLIQFEVEYLKA